MLFLLEFDPLPLKKSSIDSIRELKILRVLSVFSVGTSQMFLQNSPFIDKLTPLLKTLRVHVMSMYYVMTTLRYTDDI